MALLLSVLLHLIVVGSLFWLLQKSRIVPRAINRGKITLNLAQIHTLPPKPPASPQPPVPRPTPPIPKTTPKPKPTPTPTPKPKQPPAPLLSSGAAPEKTGQKSIKTPDTNTSREPKKPSSKIALRMTEKPKKSSGKAPKKSPPRTHAKTSRKHSAERRRHAAQKPVSRRRSVLPRPRGPDRKLISRLYGSSYSRLGSAQRRFIDQNLRKILEISQRTLNYLGYPSEAVRFREQGTNLVEFWLHPNGDISGLRLKRRIGSPSLDRQTIEVIKTAYMYYPRPKVRTKIIIYVRYKLY